jgi:hypothetical protein
MKFEIYGDKLDLADELLEDFRKVARGAVRDGSKILLEESHRLIKQYGPGPAPPGSTPGTGETGNLLKMTKLGNVRFGRDKRSYSGAVIYAPHAYLLEYGHTNVDGTRTLPRPFIRPAQEAAQPKIHRLFEERL